MISSTDPVEASKYGVELHRQMSGDEHSGIGLRYECAFRCIWLLNLRGTNHKIIVGAGEDAKISNGNTVFRQVKKRDAGLWHFSDLRDFIANAYTRFTADASVRHEFYTDGGFQHSGHQRLIQNKRLNPEHPAIQHLLSDLGTKKGIEAFCQSVSLYERQWPPDRSFEEIDHVVRKAIDENFPGSEASTMLAPVDISPIIDRLIRAEYELWTTSRIFSWSDVDEKIHFERFLADLAVSSMAEGRIKSWEAFIEGADQLPSEGTHQAIEELTSNRTIARPIAEERVLEGLKSWLPIEEQAGKRNLSAHYKVILISGAHGSGKTSTLLRLGRQINEQFPQVSVCTAVDLPPQNSFIFRSLGILQKTACVVLIDDLFEGWHGLVSNINYPLIHPTLFIATASQPEDHFRTEALLQRLGKRMEIVPLATALSDEEVGALGKLRGVPISEGEWRKIKLTNIRHAIQVISGELPHKHLSEFREFLHDKPEYKSWILPILWTSSMRVPLPKLVLEDYSEAAFPLDVQPWVVQITKYGQAWVIFEDPHESRELVELVGGPTKERWILMMAKGLLAKIDPANAGHRSFVRLLCMRLALDDLPLLASLLENQSELLNAVLAREPLWALVFCWLPLLSDANKENLIALAVSKLGGPPDTIASFSIFIEAFGTEAAIQYLERMLAKAEDWDPKHFVQFIEMLIQLPDEARRSAARNFCKFLVDLPPVLLERCLLIRNCIEQTCRLVGGYGGPVERERGFQRVGEILQSRISHGKPVTSNQIEGYISLADRLIWQHRHGLALEITKRVLLGKQSYPVKQQYEFLFLDEKRWRHRSVCRIGIELLKDAQLDPFEKLDRVPSNLLDLAASWGDEEEWMQICESMLDVLDDLTKLKVTFNRVSRFVLPLFPPIRRGPQSLSERFARILLRWIPNANSEETEQVGALTIKSLGFFHAQAWLPKEVKELSAEILMNLLDSKSRTKMYQEWLDSVCAALGEEKMVIHPTLGLVPKWREHISLGNTYLAAMGRVQWSESQRTKVSRSMLGIWQNSPGNVRYLIETLLRLRLPTLVYDLATRFVKSRSNYPDAYGLLAIANAQLREQPKVMALLSDTIELREKRGKGLRPHLTAWIHRELAHISSAFSRPLHLVCAELETNAPLRPYDIVVGDT